MEKLFEWKNYLLKFYAKYSLYIDKTGKFLTALLIFAFISGNIGFSEVMAHPVVTVTLALICAFLPAIMTVVIATLMTLLQFYTLSTGIAVVAGVLFFVMYALYVRYTPDKAMLLLLVPIAFMLRVPMAIPIIFALVGSPACILPITMGTIIYYMIYCVKSYTTLLGTVSNSGVMNQVAAYTKQLLTNREMWCTIIAFAICVLLVYNLRRMAEEHAWEIAIVTGALGYFISMALGYIIMDVSIAYGILILGSIVSVVIAFGVEFFVFSVDYSRTEFLQFEDDEYYYHVKAVPKVSVATAEKTITHINERQKTDVWDIEEVLRTELQNRQNVEEDEIQTTIEE